MDWGTAGFPFLGSYFFLSSLVAGSLALAEQTHTFGTFPWQQNSSGPNIPSSVKCCVTSVVLVVEALVTFQGSWEEDSSPSSFSFL
uniref:Putative secreted protein n=1 Tax=Ixodes ricinus TaxID=34613 RepID=A0A6B0U9E1_IXORI